MIQPLRRYHRITFAVLAVVLPVVLAAGLSARRPIVTQVASQSNAPDTLVYWAEQRPADGSLPVTAVLLGNARSMRRPPRPKGFLLTYSLAWSKIVATEEAP